MERNRCLIVFSGIPGAGKTTVIHSLINILGGIHISYDSIQSNLGSWSIKTWHSTRQIAYESAKSVIQSGENYIYIDDNMYYRSMVKQFLTLCSDYSFHFLHIILQPSLSDCLSRNNARKVKVDSDHIYRMHALLLNESFWPTSCKIQNEDLKITVSTILDYINTAAFIPRSSVDSALEIQHARQATLQNKLHQADLHLRRCINQYLSKSNNQKTAGKMLSGVKKDILLSVREIQGSLEEVIQYVEEWFYRYVKEYGL